MSFDVVGPRKHKENDEDGNVDDGNGIRFGDSDFPPILSTGSLPTGSLPTGSVLTGSLPSLASSIWLPSPSSASLSVSVPFQPFSMTSILSAPASSPTTDPASIDSLPPQSTLETSLAPPAASAINRTSSALSSPSSIAISAHATNTGLSTGAVVGISVGTAVGAIAIIAALALFWIRRRNNSKGVYAPATDKRSLTGYAKRTTTGSFSEMGAVSSIFNAPNRDSRGSYGYGEGIVPLPAYSFVDDSPGHLSEGHDNDDEGGRGVSHTRRGPESASLLDGSPRIPDRSPLRSPSVSPPQPAIVYPVRDHSEHARRTSYIAALEAEAEAELGHSSRYSHRDLSGMPSRNFGTVRSMSTVSSMGESEGHEGRDLMAMGSPRHRPVSPIEED